MNKVNKSANEYFLTRQQFETRKSAGQLEVGAVYHITDEDYSKVVGESDGTNWTKLTIDGVTQNLPTGDVTLEYVDTELAKKQDRLSSINAGTNIEITSGGSVTKVAIYDINSSTASVLITKDGISKIFKWNELNDNGIGSKHYVDENVKVYMDAGGYHYYIDATKDVIDSEGNEYAVGTRINGAEGWFWNSPVGTSISLSGAEGDIVKINAIVPEAEKEIVWCTYGVTTNAEIKQALADNKLPCCQWNGYVYIYNYTETNDNIHFTSSAYGAGRRIYCTADSGWSNGYKNYESTDNKTTTISANPNDTKYPTEKAVADAITNKTENKVDKVEGKGLSTNDFTATYKNKLDGIANGATKVTASEDNGYIQINSVETQVYDDTDIREVAEGKKNTYVAAYSANAFLNSQEDTVSTSSPIITGTGDLVPLSKLKVGDTVYVKEVDVPDRWVSSLGGLPEGYQAVEYIESTGTQNISLGYSQNSNNGRVVLDFEWTNFSTSSSLFGIQASGLIFTIYTEGKYVYLGSYKSIDNTFSTVNGERQTLDITAIDGNYTIIGKKGTFTGTYPGTIAQPTYTQRIMSNAMGERRASIKVYSYKVYQDGELIRDLIPCQRKTDGVVGLYDKVTYSFFDNSGTGTIQKGEDVAVTSVSFDKLETSKVDLSEFYNKTQIDNRLANKVNTSDYNPATKTATMTQEVGKDSNGKLWAEKGATKTSQLENDSGFITEDGVPKEFYQCTYNVTTYAEISQALADGKIPYCKYNGTTHYYVGISNSKHTFGSNNDRTVYRVNVGTNNAWAYNNDNFEFTYLKTQTVNSSSDTSHYPSAKAVYDAIEANKGTVVSGESEGSNWSSITINGVENTIPQAVFVVTENNATVSTTIKMDETPAPYNGGYGFTNITITDAGFSLRDNSCLAIVCSDTLSVSSTYRNVRIRFTTGEDTYSEWVPVMYESHIAAGSSYLVSGSVRFLAYNKINFADGCFNIMSDSNTTYSTYTLGIGYGTCNTDSATNEKAVTLAGYRLVKGGIVAVTFAEDVNENATMNINVAGAKPIFYKGVALVDNIIKAGDTATFIYDDTNYILLSIDKNASEEITKTSQLINDSGYITDYYHDITKQDVLTEANAGNNISIVTSEGRNLLEQTTFITYTSSMPTVVSNLGYQLGKFTAWKENTRYTLSMTATGNGNNGSCYIRFQYTDGTSTTGYPWVWNGLNGTRAFSLTSDANKTVSGFYVSYGTNGSAQISLTNMQLEEGASATAFDKGKVVINASVPTKTSDLTNDSGFITEADIPKEAFACTYGSTPYADVTQALNDNKLPYVYKDAKLYVYSYTLSNMYYFINTLGSGHGQISIGAVAVASNNSWAVQTSYQAELTSRKVTSMSAASTDAQYPSAKCVYNAINSINVPTKTSELENDSGFLTEHQDISGKVDKVEGKGLSTNDFTDTDKTKLDGIAAGATKVSSSSTNGYIKINDTDTKVYDDTDLREVAEGKTKSYVIQSASAITGTKGTDDTYTNVTAISGVDMSKVKVGDNILIKDTGVPDYWVSRVYKDTSSVTTLAGTTWVINDDLTLPTSSQIAVNDINFTTGDGETSTYFYIYTNVQYLINGTWTYVYNKGWSNQKYRTVTFNSGAGCTNADLIAWLKDNATMTEGQPVCDLSKLETTKVDLTDYYDKTEVDDKLDEKVSVADYSPDAKTESMNQAVGKDSNGRLWTEKDSFAITESDVTVTTDATKGVAPYSTSYGYTNITVSEDAGVSWVEGGVYSFAVDTTMVVASANRNVRIRIGETDSWHPVMGYGSSILAGSTYFAKAMTVLFQYKSTVRPEGALHILYDANTTYAYLVNTYTAGELKIDDNGFGARYTLAFATTPTTETSEKYSSLVKSSSNKTTKQAFTDLTFYIDRPPQYIYTADIAAGQVSANATYETYTGMDIRYTVNTASTYVSTLDRVFLWLKDYNPVDKSFKADATSGNIMSMDKISTRFPSTVEGNIYLYYLGTNTATWYSLNPNRQQKDCIYKYTPSTGELVIVNDVVKTSQLENDSGFITPSDVPTELFWCTYGTTTFDEVIQAWSDGKIPVVKINNRLYVYSVGAESTQDYLYFNSNQSGVSYFARLKKSDNSWAANFDTLQNQNQRVTSISSSSTDSQYPTAKAVYNAIQQGSGKIKLCFLEDN